MAPPRLIARHLADPRGLLGSLVAGLMNRHNGRVNRFALEVLVAEHSDRVLEVGFGGGAMLPALLSTAAHVSGVDRSIDMVKRATTTYRAEINAGRADFRAGTIEALPFGSKQFDKMYSINTVYFWSSLEAGAVEARRVLKEGGGLALGFLPEDAMARLSYPKGIFSFRRTDDVKGVLKQAGFETVEIRRPPETAWAVMVAR